MFQIESASLSDPGRKRQNNEDYIASFEPEDPEELKTSGCLYLVADGVGGAIKGEKASRYAAQKVLFEFYRHPELSPEERLRESMRQSGNDIFNYAQDNHESRMATTMVAAVIRGEKLTIANVGDSRAYLIRDGNIQQITHDHSLVGEMVRDGLMGEEESHNSKVKNLLTRSLGGELDVHIDLFPDIPLLPGDRILLCTDGLTRYAINDELYDLAHRGTPGEVVNKLIDYANHKGGTDNISAILIEIGKPASGQELIIINPNQKQREAADWENIPTLVGEETLPRKSLVDRGKRYIPWGIFVIVGIFTIAGIISWRLRLFGIATPQRTIVPTAIRSSFMVPTETSMNIDNEIISTITISFTSTSMVIVDRELQTKIPTMISRTITATLPAAVVTTITPESLICIFKTTDVYNSISRIYEKFSLDYLDYQQYHYYQCSGETTYDNCKPRLTIESKDRDTIYLYYWIEIPDVIGSECIDKDGRLIFP